MATLVTIVTIVVVVLAGAVLGRPGDNDLTVHDIM